VSPSESDLSMTLVIPGRNAAGTLRPCLEAAAALVERGELAEIIFVDDGSTDETVKIAAEYSVRCVEGPARGPGAARNVGWRLAKTPLIWFIDSDCVTEDNTLAMLVSHFQDPMVVGVGGSYSNLTPHSLIASLIHEEMCLRHRKMSRVVNFLGSYNVAYRRCVLEQVGGFDEEYFNAAGSPGAEDAELSFQLSKLNHRLHFEPRSCVGHYHPTSLRRYLRAQHHHGYWRVFLYRRHPDVATGDSYSRFADHIQPPTAMAILATLPLLVWPPLGRVSAALAFWLLLAQTPTTIRLMLSTRQMRYLLFSLFGFVRAFARGLGMTAAVVAILLGKRRRTGSDCF